MARKRRGRGEGSIHQRREGTWEAKVSLGYDGDGKRRRKTVYGKTKGEVQDKLRKLQNGTSTGALADATKLTVAQYMGHWLNGPAKESVSDTTWPRYEQLIRLRINPFIGGVRLPKLTHLHVEQMLADLRASGVSARGRQMAVNVLSGALKHATRMRPPLIPFNPVASVIKPTPPKPEIKPFTPEQVAKLFEATASDRLFALYLLAIDTGMREGELFALEWDDIDFASGSVMVRRALKEVKGRVWVEDLKTEKSRRRIELTQATMDALLEHRKRQLIEGNAGKLVLCALEGGYLRRPNLTQRSFLPALKRAGLPRIRFHDLRHTAATLLLLANERTKVVSERLGHASTATTEACYQHVLPTMQKQGAEKMNAILGALISRKADAEVDSETERGLARGPVPS
jgi:integrase